LETFSILHRGYKKVYPAIVALEEMLFKEKGDETVRPEGSLFEQRSEAAITPKPQEISADPSKSREEREAALRMRIATKSEKLNLQNILGFINQKKVNASLNISNIMRLKKMSFEDLYSTMDLDTLLLRDSILRRFTLVITCYFCLGTELRFLK